MNVDGVSFSAQRAVATLRDNVVDVQGQFGLQ